MKIKFDVTVQELVIVKFILQDILPSGCKVWVFGSHAKHQAKFNSDLDLTLDCNEKLTSSVMLRLEEAFEESRLPYTVDLVDLTTVEPYFREIIDKQKVEFPLKRNVPKLRFPEFNGEWEESALKNLVKINQGLQIPISERFTEARDDRYFYITNEFIKGDSKKRYFIESPPKSVVCNNNDVLMTRTGNTGIVVTGVEGAFHNNFFKIAYPRFC